MPILPDGRATTVEFPRPAENFPEMARCEPAPHSPLLAAWQCDLDPRWPSVVRGDRPECRAAGASTHAMNRVKFSFGFRETAASPDQQRDHVTCCQVRVVSAWHHPSQSVARKMAAADLRPLGDRWASDRWHQAEFEFRGKMCPARLANTVRLLEGDTD